MGAANDNICIGYESGLNLSVGNENVCIGTGAGDSITSGSYSVCIGDGAGSAFATSSRHVFIGKGAGGSTTSSGQNNICIGYATGTSAGGADGEIVLGYALSGFSSLYTTLGYNTDKSYLAHGSTSWSGTSDVRYKKNIEDSTAGLSFINDLRPITYQWKNKGEIPSTSNEYEEGSTEQYRNSKVNHGFVAQEVKQAIDNHSEIQNGFNMWHEADDGEQAIAEAALIPMLVKAIQELSAEVETLKSQIGD
jgi:hypothetical protein